MGFCRPFSLSFVSTVLAIAVLTATQPVAFACDPITLAGNGVIRVFKQARAEFDERKSRLDRQNQDSVINLGCNGAYGVWHFKDAVLMNGPGHDLLIGEAKNNEAFRLEVAGDDQDWRLIGEFSGGSQLIDIAAADDSEEGFRFVRLTSTKDRDCGKPHAGADISTVAAIRMIKAPLRPKSLTINYNFASAALSASDLRQLEPFVRVLKEKPRSFLRVVGHTDDVGDDTYNQKLSVRRAEAVAEVLTTKTQLSRADMEVVGRGAGTPVATNQTEQGRSANRRSEIKLITAQECPPPVPRSRAPG